MYTGTDYTALTLMSLHKSFLRSLRIVQRHLDAFKLHCSLSLSLQHPTPGYSVRMNYIWYYVCMRYYNIYLEHDACNLRTSIKLNRFCVLGQKMCELSANGKDREWGRGGLATCVGNANEYGPPQLFLHCCAYGLLVSFLYRKVKVRSDSEKNSFASNSKNHKDCSIANFSTSGFEYYRLKRRISMSHCLNLYYLQYPGPENLDPFL